MKMNYVIFIVVAVVVIWLYSLVDLATVKFRLSVRNTRSTQRQQPNQQY